MTIKKRRKKYVFFNWSSNFQVECLGNLGTSYSWTLNTSTYGSKFYVVIDISAYEAQYTLNISTSGTTYEYLKSMSKIITTYNVDSFVGVISVSGSGSITISYTSPDINIHAGQLTIIY